MIEWNNSDRSVLVPLFESLELAKTMVLPWLDMGIGKTFVDSLEHPRIALFSFSALSFIAGDASLPEAREMLKEFPPFQVLFVPDERWSQLVKDEWGDDLRVQVRNRLDGRDLNIDKLRELKGRLSDEFELRKINLDILHSTDRKLLENLTHVYDSFEKWIEQGFGFCILHEGKVVSLAYTCFPFDKEFEIQVNTLASPKYRHKGLATIVCAALIEYGLEHDLVPEWDAANPISINLAKKLGYVDPRPYEVYFRIRSS